MKEETTTEWCPYCCEEVELPIKLGKYKCPNCGEMIANCSMCEKMDCNICVYNTDNEDN